MRCLFVALGLLEACNSSPPASNAAAPPTTSAAPVASTSASAVPVAAASSAPPSRETVTLGLTIARDGQIILGAEPLELDAVPARVREHVKNGPIKVVVMADKDVAQSRVASAMDKVREGGVTDVAIGDPPPRPIVKPPVRKK